ncbi:MAG TPA: hypothetical protein VEJ18_11875 [Planctomycetota bacterium]|nr:hypothetical protein [Planctomycetota bacterium]
MGDALVRHWPILVGLLAAAIAWGKHSQALKSIAAELHQIGEKFDALVGKVHEVDNAHTETITRVERLELDVKDVRGHVHNMKNDIYAVTTQMEHRRRRNTPKP